MNQDTHLYIEANQKHGHGYQVVIVCANRKRRR